jgi:hypothetical protein
MRAYARTHKDQMDTETLNKNYQKINSIMQITRHALISVFLEEMSKHA